jgi:ribokinase
MGAKQHKESFMVADKRPIVVVGSINMDMVAYATQIPVAGQTLMGSDFQLHPGGKGANQAVAVGRLGYPVSMIGRVGSDAFGAPLKASLAEAGVNVECVMMSAGASGVAAILVAESGQNCIVVIPGANAQLSPADIEMHLSLIRSAGLVLTQLEIPLETVIHLATICRRESVPLMLDPAPARELPEELLHLVDWFTPNETEAAFFMAKGESLEDEEAPSELAQKLMAKGPSGIVLKLGLRGSYLAGADGLSAMIPAPAVEAVDTVAAGDCFNGAFATGLMMSMSPLEAAHFASVAAAISVTRAGAQSSMPRLEEVQRLHKGWRR